MKEKTIVISGIEVPMKISAYTPVLYSDIFNQNIFAEMQDIITVAGKTGTVPFEKVTVLYRLAYCMAKHADKTIPAFEEWLDQFDVYDIPASAGELIGLWGDDNQSQSTP